MCSKDGTIRIPCDGDSTVHKVMGEDATEGPDQTEAVLAIPAPAIPAAGLSQGSGGYRLSCQAGKRPGVHFT